MNLNGIIIRNCIFRWTNPLRKHRFLKTKGTVHTPRVWTRSHWLEPGCWDCWCREIRGRGDMRITTIYYIDHPPPISIPTSPALLIMLALLFPFSLFSTSRTATCKHILVKFLREQSCISITVRRKSSSLGRISSQHFRLLCIHTRRQRRRQQQHLDQCLLFVQSGNLCSRCPQTKRRSLGLP